MFSAYWLKYALALVMMVLTMTAWSASTGTYQSAEGEPLSDPTRPADWQAKPRAVKKAVNYKLSYILNAKDRKQAIVNGKKVTVGDWVVGAKVIGISDDEVTLLVSGKRQTLRVNGKRASIKQ